MTRAVLLAAALLLGAALPSASAQKPLPTFDTAGDFAFFGTLCDCNESDFVFRTRGPLAGHAEPFMSSPVVRMVDAGRLIEGNDWDYVVTVVHAPQTGVLAKPVRLRGARQMPDPRRGAWGVGVEMGDVMAPAGTRVEVYSDYAGEGYVRYGDTTYLGGVPSEDDVTWDPMPVARPYDSTWYRLIPRRGAPAAWVWIRNHTDETNVEMLCETHNGCVGNFKPTYRPNRP